MVAFHGCICHQMFSELHLVERRMSLVVVGATAKRHLNSLRQNCGRHNSHYSCELSRRFADFFFNLLFGFLLVELFLHTHSISVVMWNATDPEKSADIFGFCLHIFFSLSEKKLDSHKLHVLFQINFVHYFWLHFLLILSWLWQHHQSSRNMKTPHALFNEKFFYLIGIIFGG